MKKILLSLLVIALVALVGCEQPDLPPEPGVPGEQVIADAGNGSVGAAFLQAYADRGYSPPHDIFNNDAPLITVPTNVVFDLGVNSIDLQVDAVHPNGLVYYRGYYFDKDGVATAFDFSAAGSGIYGSNWFEAAGTTEKPALSKTLSLARDDLAEGENFIFTYSCEKRAGEWKCGCTTDDDCNNWRISDYNATIVNDLTDPSAPTDAPQSLTYADGSEAVITPTTDFILDPAESGLEVNVDMPFTGSSIYEFAYYYREGSGWTITQLQGTFGDGSWLVDNQNTSFQMQRGDLVDGMNYFAYNKCDLVNYVWDCRWHLASYDVTIETLTDEPIGLDAITFTETRVTDDPAIQALPSVSGDKIVWIDYRNCNNQIHAYDINTEVETQISDCDYVGEPNIDNDKVVWTDGNIYVYDLNTNIETEIINGDTAFYTKISGNKLAWQDNRISGDSNIFSYDLITGIETQITSDETDQTNARISGDKIVWHDKRNSEDFWNPNNDIYLFDLNTGVESQIVGDTSNQLHPSISVDKVVWEDERNGFGIKDIYLLDLNTGVESQITDGASYNFHPSISGDRIVWVKSIDNMGSVLYNIYVYDLNLGVKTLISSTDANVIIHPDIDGNRIVWEDIRNGNRDIYMATIN